MTDRELRDLLTRADSYLSLLRHRGGIRWGEQGYEPCPVWEVDRVIGELRQESEKMRREIDRRGS